MMMQEALSVEAGEATDQLIDELVMGEGLSGEGFSPSQPGGLQDAMSAVLKMAKDDGRQEFNLHFSDGVWSAYFPCTPTATGPTAELAICRALLANWARKQSGGLE